MPGAVVSAVARRHGLSPQQVFTWRRQSRRLSAPKVDDPLFVPAVVDAAAPAAVDGHERKTDRRKRTPDAGSVEIEAYGVTIRVGRGADAAMVAAIVHALKATR
jgi:transposase